MGDTTGNIFRKAGDTTCNLFRKAGIGLGLLALPFIPSLSQDNPIIVKFGPTYNIIQTDEISKECFGLETLLEKKLKGRLFAEWETGLYSNVFKTNSLIYSKMQTNIGLEYKPIIKGGWSMGGKVALGASSEFYKYVEEDVNSEIKSINKLIGLDVEKIFKDGAGVNISVSKEIDRNSWRIGAKAIFKTGYMR